MRLTSHKIKGSALPMVIILSFVILVFMSAMAYNFKMDLESIRVSLNYENLESLNQDNIDGIGDEIDNLPDSDYTIGIHEVDGYVFITFLCLVNHHFIRLIQMHLYIMLSRML